jgi:hypothetical protein
MFLGMPLFYLTADPDRSQTAEKMHAHSRDILQSHLQPSSFKGNPRAALAALDFVVGVEAGWLLLLRTN